MNALAKGMALQYPIIMVVWARYLSQTVLTALVFNRHLKTIVKTQKTKWRGYIHRELLILLAHLSPERQELVRLGFSLGCCFGLF